MTGLPLLDTHAWFWWLDGSGRLKGRERNALDVLPAASRPFLCAISVWEMALLVQLHRVTLRQGFEAWIDVAASQATVTLVDVTPAIAKELFQIPSSFPRDPADGLIIATASRAGSSRPDVRSGDSTIAARAPLAAVNLFLLLAPRDHCRSSFQESVSRSGSKKALSMPS
ncbi:MAG: type II toxin-antitoxin system VapC family toxin [Candidatus Binatia bacterium]